MKGIPPQDDDGKGEVCYSWLLKYSLRSASMLLSHCPNCQHDNPPGERFCAACGVPLDLKPCPVCGKVDNVKATVCAGCGAHFPALSGGHVGDSSVEAAPTRKPIPPVVAPPPTTIRALPLIVVALAAGGIPLLWLYRNTMPVPKAWQGQNPGVEAPTAPAPQVVPPAAPAPALIPLPPKPIQQPVVQAAPPEEPAKPPVPVAAKPAMPAKHAAKPAARAAPPQDSASASASASAAARPAAPAAPATTECTEALAAVGLCDPKAGK